ncbi:hypothetical protein VT84_05530 [Gemmata sp. SH-PL17]|uniref:hypothetical protein n=1 Tax=Gemmata sp. SH-PL17 TaxID=1630693 RepID=UPI00078CEAB0|nr:hypothetical protein [Gemmata sp. SH-PL17]AMV23853.1 hypothetical protein VT84_05530 [Gemmata sp. SH-PL17]
MFAALYAITAAASLTSSPVMESLQPPKVWKDKLVSILTIKDTVDEGTEGSKGSTFPPSGGTTYNTLTYPGTLEVTDPGESGEGVIKYSFKARIRKKNYEAGAEVGTHDSNINGVITAKYSFTFSGKVLIDVKDIKYESGNEHNAGRCIYNRIKNTNGATVK